MMKEFKYFLCKIFGHISVDDIPEDEANKFLEENDEKEVGIRCVRCGVELKLFY